MAKWQIIPAAPDGPDSWVIYTNDRTGVTVKKAELPSRHQALKWVVQANEYEVHDVLECEEREYFFMETVAA
jgi:hypothetical protein